MWNSKSVHVRVLSPIAAALAVLAGALVPAEAPAGGLDFLVPGISLRSVEFNGGSKVSYMIISESYGIPDTSLVELAVLEAGGGYALIEVSTSPYPRLEAETVRIRMRLSEQVRGIESADEFSSHTSEIVVKDGEDPFREPSPEDLEELELERMFMPSPDDSMRASLGTEEFVSPAGVFSCDKEQITVCEQSEVGLGGVEAVRVERERTTLWLSSEVPFWGLVKSRIERESSTMLVNAPSFRQAPRRSVTESVLVSFSSGDR